MRWSKANPISLNSTIRRWIKGLDHTKSIPQLITPAWYLELVLATLTRVLFEPMENCPMKYLTWKTVFLL